MVSISIYPLDPSDILEYSIRHEKKEIEFEEYKPVTEIISFILRENLSNQIAHQLAIATLKHLIDNQIIQTSISYSEVINAQSQEIFEHIQECIKT